MDGETRARRERWKQRTDAAFERMCAGKTEEELVSLEQREDMAMLLAKEMAAFLLEENLAQDAAAAPPTACCPRCGGEGSPAVQSKEPMPKRKVTTRAGDIAIGRQRWRCAKCRILFFSVRHSARPGRGGI
jgi:hypothetical protein